MVSTPETTDLLPPADEPPMGATEVLTRLDIMIGCMDLWAGKKGEMAGLMQGWGRWLRHARPFVADAAARSNAR